MTITKPPATQTLLLPVPPKPNGSPFAGGGSGGAPPGKGGGTGVFGGVGVPVKGMPASPMRQGRGGYPESMLGEYGQGGGTSQHRAGAGDLPPRPNPDPGAPWEPPARLRTVRAPQ